MTGLSNRSPMSTNVAQRYVIAACRYIRSLCPVIAVFFSANDLPDAALLVWKPRCRLSQLEPYSKPALHKHQFSVVPTGGSATSWWLKLSPWHPSSEHCHSSIFGCEQARMAVRRPSPSRRIKGGHLSAICAIETSVARAENFFAPRAAARWLARLAEPSWSRKSMRMPPDSA